MKFHSTDMLYKENGKKNTYKEMGNDLSINSTLSSSTDAFRQDCLRREIT